MRLAEAEPGGLGRAEEPGNLVFEHLPQAATQALRPGGREVQQKLNFRRRVRSAMQLVSGLPLFISL
jgi:hypothetical protein